MDYTSGIYKRVEVSYKEFPHKGYRVTEYGTVETSKGKATEYISIFKAPTEVLTKKLFVIFFIDKVPKRTKTFTYPEMLRQDGMYYLIVRKDKLSDVYLKVLSQVFSLAQRYTVHTRVMRNLFNIYGGVVMTWSGHRYLNTYFDSEDIDNLERSVLYYSQPEKLQFIERETTKHAKESVKKDETGQISYRERGSQYWGQTTTSTTTKSIHKSQI